MGYLFFKEVIEYGEPMVTSAVTVDTTRMEMGYLNVTLNMEFPSTSIASSPRSSSHPFISPFTVSVPDAGMPCSYFGIDSVDHLGHVLVDATGPTSDLQKIPIRSLTSRVGPSSLRLTSFQRPRTKEKDACSRAASKFGRYVGSSTWLRVGTPTCSH